jgi:hypothetical protein
VREHRFLRVQIGEIFLARYGRLKPPFRPALSDERVELNTAGQVALKLETPWRGGTAHLVMSPLEFMQRLSALVPRPRLHLIRCHGVLAPNAKLRSLVVPRGRPRRRNRPPRPQQPPASAKSTLSRPGRDASLDEAAQARV